VPNIPRLSQEGKQQGDPNFDRNIFLKRKAEARRRIVDAAAERAAKVAAEAAARPDRSFAEQIEALRRVCNHQIAALEILDSQGVVLDPKQFKALQSLAFVVRSLSAEARAAGQNFDPAHASDAELAQLAGDPEDTP
jgi:hypothetical protein